MRGDVPMTPWGLGVGRGFSPRARGCSYCIAASRSSSAVFPACAGMFLRAAFQLTARTRFPRVRGDVPSSGRVGFCRVTFSPRARGCSLCITVGQNLGLVFPACAGMFLTRPFTRLQIGGFPRVRGDVPKCNSKKAFLTAFSPRARGCSFVAATRTPPLRVFPAHAGMFPTGLTTRPTLICFPRARGDVPMQVNTTISLSAFSPRTRGCSEAPGCPGAGILVFPAHAGMFRVNM